MHLKTPGRRRGDTGAMKSHRPALAAPAVALCALTLPGCDGHPPAATPNPAETSFTALVAECTRTVDARTPVVAATDSGAWSQTGYSPALVQGEVRRTESPATPYVGKIVVKDNIARATAPTEAQARALAPTPDHVLANRTHTFVYSYDGTRWHWQNGMRLSKSPTQADTTEPLALADVETADGGGLAGCLPR